MLAEAGLIGIPWPREHGGQGGTLVQQAIAGQEFARARIPTLINHIGIGMCGPTVIAHGSDDQKSRYLARLLRADDVWCQLFSEPASGSDLAALRTTAVRDGDDWVVNGQKVWTTLAHVADYGILLTRTDPERPKHAGLTMFVVDMHAPGVTVRPLRQMAGGAGFNEVFFDDVRIPDAERLGEPGEGWRVALTTLMNERVAIGGAGSDIGVPVETFAAHARERLPALPGDRQVLARQAVGRAVVASLATRYTGYRRFTVLSQGGLPGPEASAGKLAGTAAAGWWPTPGCGCSATTPSTRPPPTATTPGSAPRRTCPGWRSPAAPTRCCATSSASGCWACRRNPGPTSRAPSPEARDELRPRHRPARRRRRRARSSSPARRRRPPPGPRSRAARSSPGHKALADIGFLGITVAEDAGGAGGSLLDLAVVAEQGGAVLAGPSLVTAARAAVLLADVPELAAQLADGSTAFAVLDGRPTARTPRSTPPRRPPSWRSTAARWSSARARRPPGSRWTPPAGWPRSGSPTAGCWPRTPRELWARARQVAAVVLAAEDLGAADRAVQLGVAYAKERQAFGRPIGSYQAVKHMLVDAWVGVDQLRSLVWWAAWAADAAPDELPLAASAAKAHAAPAFERAAETLIQVHGGIGFTWEHDAHLYWRRAKVDRLLLGDEAEHLDAVARLAGGRRPRA